MSELPILVSASLLERSPANVRKSSDAEADARLEANIAERGILQNLVGVPLARKKGHYRITAGGRRLDAVHRLIAAGTLAADYAVPVLVLKNPKDAVEISLSENFFRLDMNPAQACRAFRDVIEVEGKTPADVAKRFGVAERFVLGRLRLANLAEPIFDALEAGEITLDVAKAYASTSDTARQAAVYDALSHAYYRDNVSEIRRQLAAHSYRANDPQALLVGREAYLAAGGRIDEDLFSDESTQRWIDPQLVDELAAARMAEAAEAVRERDGLGEVRAIVGARVPYYATLSYQRLHGEVAPLTEEQDQRRQELEAEIEQWNDAVESGNFEAFDDDEDRIEALEKELGALIDRPDIIPEEQKGQALAYLVIGEDGVPCLSESYYVLPPEESEEEDEADADADGGDEDDGAAEESSADQEPEAGKAVLSQRLLERLAMMKTELLALHVASDPGFALDLATFLLADTAGRHYSNLPSELRGPEPSSLIHGFQSGAPAAQQWDQLGEGLDRSWHGGTTPAERFDAFRSLPDEARAAWLGWLMARTLRASIHGTREAAFLDHLGVQLEIDVAAWWRPTALTYFDKISKAALLDLFAEIGGPDLKSRYAGSKKHDLAAAAERLFAGDVLVEAEVKERALTWLPDAMRFDHSHPADDAPEAPTVAEDAMPGEQPESGEIAGEDGGDQLAAAA
ncbi:MAG: ParB/RepB/Spo0J family partition protein [Sphingomonadales bacterium]|nr:ParB/RepB/Spo0J family partition protein [Sphingomonadales bacterium]MDE2169414.1 ParB/RepB/Spo0J family partition protein [Sphingomonadales bacterium]